MVLVAANILLWQWHPLAGAVGAVGLLVWVWRVLLGDRLLWKLETITGRDLDGDGTEGRPDHPFVHCSIGATMKVLFVLLGLGGLMLVIGGLGGVAEQTYPQAVPIQTAVSTGATAGNPTLLISASSPWQSACSQASKRELTLGQTAAPTSGKRNPSRTTVYDFHNQTHTRSRVDSEVIVPLLQTGITALAVTFVLVFIAWRKDLAWDVPVWGGAATFCIMWVWRILRSDALLWRLERITGRELDGKPGIGKPA